MKKLLLLVNIILIWSSDMYCAANTERLNSSDALIIILSHASNLKDLNDLSKLFTCVCKSKDNMFNKQENPKVAKQIIDLYLKNKLKTKYSSKNSQRYYIAVNTLAEISNYNNILKLLNYADIKGSTDKKYDIISSNDIEDLDFLITIGADINVKNFYGCTALIDASYHGSLEKARLLINAGADINASNYRRRDTALIIASYHGYTEIAELLIKAGAEINTKNLHEDTALRIALLHGHLDTSELLINSGVDINVKELKLMLETRIGIQLLFRVLKKCIYKL